jgi:O-antigen ligase
MSHPLLGSGVLSFDWRHKLGDPHSIFLELWYEGGIFLLLSFLAFFFYVLVLGIQQALRSRLAQGAFLFLGGMGGTFIHMWTALNITQGKMLWIGLGGVVAIQLLRGHRRSLRERGPALHRGRTNVALDRRAMPSRAGGGPNG